MTDLISRLADDLSALNNASPRLPRKDQIEDVLRKGIQSWPVHLHEWKGDNGEHCLVVNSASCPANIGGQHSWRGASQFSNVPQQCVCGAVKP